MSERVRVMLSYRGRVQGVGFRATTERIARGFAVSGWVRNEADGSVSMVAEGELAEIEHFLAAIRERMSGFIRSEDRQDARASGEFADFDIRR